MKNRGALDVAKILIGNLISLCASAFLCLGGLARSRKGIYLFQFCECVFLVMSQLVFGQFAGAAAMGIGALRNLFAYRGRYSLKLMLVCLVLTGAFGLFLNGQGLPGMIPVAASLLLTLSAYLFSDVIKLRLVLIATLAMWVIYALLIFDIVTALTNAAALVINVVILNKQRNSAKHKPTA